MGTNLGHVKTSFSTFWLLKLIFKSPRFVPFGANLTHFEPNMTPLCLLASPSNRPSAICLHSGNNGPTFFSSCKTWRIAHFRLQYFRVVPGRWRGCFSWMCQSEVSLWCRDHVTFEAFEDENKSWCCELSLIGADHKMIILLNNSTS